MRVIVSGLPRLLPPKADMRNDDKDLRQKKTPARIRGRERRYGSFLRFKVTKLHRGRNT